MASITATALSWNGRGRAVALLTVALLALGAFVVPGDALAYAWYID